jgi:hypothetical protein
MLHRWARRSRREVERGGERGREGVAEEQAKIMTS